MNPITIHPTVQSNSVDSNTQQSIVPQQIQNVNPIPGKQVATLADPMEQAVKLQSWMNLINSGGVIPDFTSSRNEIQQRLLEDLITPVKNSPNVVDRLSEDLKSHKQQNRELEPTSEADIIKFDI
jgi:hypothetical protein